MLMPLNVRTALVRCHVLPSAWDLGQTDFLSYALCDDGQADDQGKLFFLSMLIEKPFAILPRLMMPTWSLRLKP